MHILISIVIIGVILFILFRQVNANQAEPSSEPRNTIDGVHTVLPSSIAYIAKGKLFFKPQQGEIREIHSEHVQTIIDRMENSKKINGWKENTSWGTSFAGSHEPMDTQDKINIEFSAAVLDEKARKLIYFLKDENFGGLFSYDIDADRELRLLHRQHLSFRDLRFDTEHRKVLGCSEYANGIANVFLMDASGDSYTELTAGDSYDSAPCWAGEKRIVYQSQGHARNTQGYVLAYGPASIQLLDMDTSEVSTVLADDNMDFLQPEVCSQGKLYYIRRPYQTVQYNGGQLLSDIVFFPFRLLRAVFHYLNFFSMMYSRKPLTTASGPRNQIDAKEIMLKGMRINAERALQKERSVNGIPSLVPSTWQLVCRDLNGQESVLCSNVSSFSIGSDDQIIYSNGCGVFLLQNDGSSQLLLKDNIIEDVIV